MQLLIDALVPFASTFAGVFLAFLLGVWWQRHERQQEEERLRLETKAALSAELEGIHNQVLRASKVWQDDEDNIPLPEFPSDAKESAVASGRFILLELPLQTEVSHIYTVIGEAIDYRTNLLPPRLSFSPSPYPEILEQYKDHLQHLEERIPPLVIALAPK